MEQLLRQLVYTVTGISEESDSWATAWRQVQAILDKHRSISTEEHIIDERYSRLADKFTIKGYDDLADDLTSAKARYHEQVKRLTVPQRILSYDMLSLLLSLSDSPLDHPYDRQQQRQQLQKKGNMIIRGWDDIVQEEPLEGSHWQSWDDVSTDDNEDDDWINTTDHNQCSPNSNQKQKSQWSSPPLIQSLSSTQNRTQHHLLPLEDANQKLVHLKKRQYWHHASCFDMEISETADSVLHDPQNLNEALCKTKFIPQMVSNQRVYIMEVDAIREVLFLLRGYESVIFKYNMGSSRRLHDSIFYYDTSFSIRHLSNQSFTAMMNAFCRHADMLYKLRRQVKKSAHVRRNGQSFQAFLVVVSSLLSDFEGLIAELEKEIILGSTLGSKKIISLLQLQEKLREPLSCLSSICDIITQCSQFVSSSPSTTNARSMATFLLSTLFTQTMNAQMTGNKNIYETMLYVFNQTLVPYARLLDDWMMNGSLYGDVAGEFFIKRNPEVSETSTKYWSEGYSIDDIDSMGPDCPLFTTYFTSRVLFVGKTVNLSRKIHTSQSKSFTKHHIQFKTLFRRRFAIPAHRFFPSPMQKIPRNIKPNYCEKTSGLNPFVQHGMPNFIQYSLPETQASPSNNTDNTDVYDREQDRSAIDLLSLFEEDLEECLHAYVDKPYAAATKLLLSTLQQKEAIYDHLRSISTIYLMLDSDLMHVFCESIFAHMDRKLPWHDHSFINQAFADACQISGCPTSMTMVNMKMLVGRSDWNERRKTSLPAALKALSTATYLGQLTTDYKIPWPINNFIEPQCIKIYDKILHLLLRIKRAKYVLEKRTLWSNRHHNASMKWQHQQDSGLIRLYTLRMRMMWFVNAFWRYVMTSVLHADTKLFLNCFANIQSADEIPTLHERYLGKIVDKCLLNDKSVSIRKAVIHILDMVEQLTDLFGGPHEDIMDQLVPLEKDFVRTNEFIATSLSIMGKKGGLEWFDMLSTSLSV